MPGKAVQAANNQGYNIEDLAVHLPVLQSIIYQFIEERTLCKKQ